MKLAAAQRRMVSELVIGLSICGGAYYFLVQPLKKELLTVRAKSAAMLATSPVTAPPDPKKIDALFAGLEHKVATVDAAGEPARNEAVMFTRVNELSRRFDIRVDELRTVSSTPLKPIIPAASPGATPAQPPTPTPPIGESLGTLVQYEFAARGSYPNITAFLNAFNAEMGYTLIRFVRITPHGEESAQALSVVVKTEHVHFNTAPVKALLTATAAPTDASASGGTAP